MSLAFGSQSREDRIITEMNEDVTECEQSDLSSSHGRTGRTYEEPTNFARKSSVDFLTEDS